MLTYELFLSRSTKSRLEFYQQFIDLPSKYQEVGEVAKIRRISPTSVYRQLTVINADMNKIRAELGAAPVANTAEIHQRFNIPTALYAIYLMRNSLVGRFIMATLRHPAWDVADFAQREHVSKATVFRRLRPLRDYLRDMNISVNFSPISLVGRETVVRITLSELVWQLGQDGHEMFPELNGLPQRTAEHLLDAHIIMPRFNRDKLTIICAVNMYRSNQGHALQIIKPLQQVFTATGCNLSVRDLPEYVRKYPATCELVHIQSVLNANYHDANEQQLIGFVGHHARSNSACWQLVSQVVHRMRGIAGVKPQMLDDQVLIANLLAITVALDLIGANVPAFEPLIIAAGAPAPKSLQVMLQQVFSTLPQHLSSFKRIQTGLITRFLPLLGEVLPDARARVRVAIDQDMEHCIYVGIREALERMPAVELVDNPKYARLIVSNKLTDYSTVRPRGDRRYYFALSSYSAWLTLEHLIHYLAIYECDRKTGPGINYTHLDPTVLLKEVRINSEI
ncbi:helix-turn-helix domain-containing protein [Lacticaseibacillus zhaodongensis]|uniref:helix-turn-helix domain-containing protein n=1 Tax=Lacticaseibacillus zhaodongensis TaxID=2668065 RepID=UPI0012D2BDAF|nr:helix-turn-helix domain-containing protein [Lacticaseibacillus zhaodongensis]